MGSYRSKEDDVNRISTSIFVTNFPESFTAKYLFHSCKQCGHVVDSFIPVKRSKEGKRFGFVCFINVFNVERMNSVEEDKTYVKKSVVQDRGVFQVPRKDVGGVGNGNSFIDVVKSRVTSGMVGGESSPAIVLGDESLNTKDVSNALMGRVKEFASLTNLKMALANEGFIKLNIRYMGELWVLLEFGSLKSKELFQEHTGVEIKGVPFKLWSGNTFKRLAAKWGDLLDVDDQEESCFHSKRICLYTKYHMNILESFKMIFRGKVFWIRAKEVPGWVSDLLEDSEYEEQSEDGFMEGDNKTQDVGSSDDVAEVPA
nr:nucleotide-binding alpha-beta plait domain-containing protein [Tanacetum cinerariifolium]